MARRAGALPAAVVVALMISATAFAQQKKTPWGDPDLQGTWSGDSAFAIPRERPEALGTKAELSDQEYAEKVTRDAAQRKRAENAQGPFRNDNAWIDKTFRQTSLIVEPANGRTPPLTPEAQRRQTAAPRGTYGNGPLDSPEDFTLYDRCISLGAVGSMTPNSMKKMFLNDAAENRLRASFAFARWISFILNVSSRKPPRLNL